MIVNQPAIVPLSSPLWTRANDGVTLLVDDGISDRPDPASRDDWWIFQLIILERRSNKDLSRTLSNMNYPYPESLTLLLEESGI